MKTCPVFFYKKIYEIIIDDGMYRGDEYLYPMQVAAFILAVKDGRKSIVRPVADLIYYINREYDESPLVLNMVETSYLQSLIHEYGSCVILKRQCNKVDFLSLLSSFTTMNQQIKFIKSILNIHFPTGNEMFEKMLFNLNINKIRESYCQTITLLK